jgi:uncharacterized protein
MEMPQEIEVWYVLPAIRRELSICLKSNGIRQKKIAEILNLTEPAVSQYLTNKRANEIKFSKEILQDIDELADKILDNNFQSCRLEYHKILNKMRHTGQLCKIHRQFYPVSDSCEMCIEGV